jgi:hypothetical protein
MATMTGNRKLRAGTGRGVSVGGGEVTGGEVTGGEVTGGDVTGGEVAGGEVAGATTKPVPVTVTDVPGGPCEGASVITGLPAVGSTIRAKTGDADAGAPRLVVSMLKDALAHSAELASAQALTVIWFVHVVLPPANVWHVSGVWVGNGVGACGAVKVPVRLPASSRAQVASSETSGLLIEHPADWACATAECDRQIGTASHSSITITRAAALCGCRFRNAIALPSLSLS